MFGEVIVINFVMFWGINMVGFIGGVWWYVVVVYVLLGVFWGEGVKFLFYIEYVES